MILKGVELLDNNVKSLEQTNDLFTKIVKYSKSNQDTHFLIKNDEHCALIAEIVNKGLFILDNLIKTDTYEF